RRTVRRSSRASTTWTAGTSASRRNWARSAPGSLGGRERAPDARAAQGPAARPCPRVAPRARRRGDRRRFAEAHLHRPGARPPGAAAQARRHTRVRDLWGRRPGHRREGHPARAGAGRLRAARSGLRLLPTRRRRAARAVGARRPGEVVVGARGDEVPAARRGVLLEPRRAGGERPPDAVAPEIHRAVDEILAAVRARGDEALLEYTARFDAFRPPAAAGLAIAPAEFETAASRLAPGVAPALAYAAERIERYHAA